MRIAILSNDKPSYSKPMADGLSKCLNRIGVENVVFYEGLDSLEFPDSNLFDIFLNNLKYIVKKIVKSKLSLFRNRTIGVDRLIKKLKYFDVIIIVISFPASVANNKLRGIQKLREFLPVPIVNYDLFFINNADGWFKQLEIEKRFGGFAGIQRFDYYLVASDVCEIPINKNVDFPYTRIGVDLNNIYLKPKQNDFKVLLDFPRQNFESYRSLQKKVLDELKLPYYELKGIYRPDEIKQIYSGTSIFFPSFRETFGLPLIELQLCGAKIFLPYSHWAPSHYLKDKSEKGIGRLGANFVVYENDEMQLKNLLIDVRNNFDAYKNIEFFENEYPDFATCNTEKLKNIVKQLELGNINGQSHLMHDRLNNEIILELPTGIPNNFRSSF